MSAPLKSSALLKSSSMTRTNPQTRKPSVAIIGPGRLGFALAVALRKSGYPILAFVSRRAEHARKAARLFNETEKLTRPLGVDQLAQLPQTDLIIIATPDDAIEETARRLAACERLASGPSSKAGRTVLHTSGALSSEVLAPLEQAGFHTGSLHPLVSVSKPAAGAKALHGAFFCLEGDKAALKLAGKIVSDLGGTSFSIRPENKALYHAAAVMASGHVVALFDLATQMLAACGLNQSTARRILLPLVQSAIANLKVSDTAMALTGTFSRGDVATVQRHLKALSQKDLAAALAVYKLLGLRSVELAQKNGIDSKVLKQIQKLLESGSVRRKANRSTK
jgi:predicted short-subunit dehydrogenase-like oxidoreductase (DUF2520 family)